MKLKSILTKTIAVAALSVAGIVTINSTNSNKAQAAIVQNDAATYRVTKSTTVYNNYENGAVTGQVLAANTNWKVIKTAYDNQGNKWYDLGKNQWVKVETTTSTTTASTTQSNQTSTTSYATSTISSYTSTATGSEASAKAWIANQESGGSYSARNGQYIGKYQLSASYLGGDYSAANQEKVADQYVHSRYGSWVNAEKFWLAHHWY